MLLNWRRPAHTSASNTLPPPGPCARPKVIQQSGRSQCVATRRRCTQATQAAERATIPTPSRETFRRAEAGVESAATITGQHIHRIAVSQSASGTEPSQRRRGPRVTLKWRGYCQHNHKYWMVWLAPTTWRQFAEPRVNTERSYRQRYRFLYQVIRRRADASTISETIEHGQTTINKIQLASDTEAGASLCADRVVPTQSVPPPSRSMVMEVLPG